MNRNLLKIFTLNLITIIVLLSINVNIFLNPINFVKFTNGQVIEDYMPSLGYTDMVYDSESNVAILYGGQTAHFRVGTTQGTTYAFDFNKNSWIELATDENLRLSAHAMAYDIESDRVILFGGGNYKSGSWFPSSETWSYDFNTDSWEKMSPLSSPSARYSHQMTYDSNFDRVIMFGGLVYSGQDGSTSEFFTDTWIYDYNSDSWEEVLIDTKPNGRTYAGLTYHVESGYTILSGGCESVAFYDTCPDFPENNTLILDLANQTWQHPPMTSVMPSKEYHELIYDSNRKTIYSFGGTPYDDEMWSLDSNLSSWNLINTSNNPEPRDRFAMTYNSNDDVVLLFGGLNESRTSMFNDTWLFSPQTQIWSEIDSIIYHATMSQDESMSFPQLYVLFIGVIMFTMIYRNKNFKKLI